MLEGLAASGKTDNRALGPKLELRRHFLRRFHGEAPPRVFDACQGSGLLWSHLRAEHPVARYWGVDVKPKRGRLAVDSARVLAQPDWDFDVIDCDTYGSPWVHWRSVLEQMPAHPVTVFLTIGWAGPAKPVDQFALEAVGLAPLIARLQRRGVRRPQSLLWKVSDIALDYCLAMSYAYSRGVIHAARTGSRSAWYYGVHLSPVPLAPDAGHLQTNAPASDLAVLRTAQSSHRKALLHE